MSNLTRRDFIKTAALGAAALSLDACTRVRVRGANEDIRVAQIGFRSQGAGHISTLIKMKGVRLVALCDVDSHVLNDKAQELKGLGINDLKTYTDIRKLVENKDIDAVSIAIPNHWHVLAAMWALEAGKDVYVEKPLSHNVWEGRQLAEAAKKHGRIVQCGMQCRSSGGIQQAVDYVQSGKLGKIVVARGFCYKPRKSIGKTVGPQAVPDYIDYDLWSGPAPLVPPRRNNKLYGPVHYDWHWFWNYGGGDLSNQGPHQMDIARWFLGEQAIAPAVLSVGGRLGYDDDAETPNTLTVFQAYEKAPLIFEVRGLPKGKQYQATGWDGNMDNYKGARVGNVIECENGYVLVPDYTSAIAYDKSGAVIQRFNSQSAAQSPRAGQAGLSADSGGHHGNWIHAVREQNAKLLNAPVLEGHLSASLCHTGNISWRLGAKKSPGQIKEILQDNKGLAEAYDRMAKHLDANGVDITKDQLQMGVPLKVDPKAERIVGEHSEEAAKLIKRDYRKPFVVPKYV